MSRIGIAQRFEDRWLRVRDSARARGPVDHLLQCALSAAVWPYRAGAWLHRTAYRCGVLPVERAETPVLCVGNLTLGGTGKTPVIEWLAARLGEDKRRCAVISRGYGGGAATMKSIEALVVSDGKKIYFGPKLAGDEPVELARSLKGVPVVIGARRIEAVRLAERQFKPDLILLDDGFQHYALARDANWVVIDATRPPERLKRFPRGSLREGIKALRRAHVVILTRCGLAPGEGIEPDALARRYQVRYPHLLVVQTRFVPRGLCDLEGALQFSATQAKGRRAVLFCGVGHPASVRGSAEAMGLEIVAEEILPDHAAAGGSMLERLGRRGLDGGAEFMVCTRKDAVKLVAAAVARAPLPILTISNQLAFLDPHDERRLMNLVYDLLDPSPPK